jgi:Domain of unknown function (DUF5658)
MASFHAFARGCAVMAMVLCAAPARAQSEEAPGTHRIPSNLRVLLGTQAILHAADMFTTTYNLQLGGIEANPILAPLSQQPVALVAFSSALNVLQIYAITKVHHRRPKVAMAWAVILVGAEAFVVANNVRAARQLNQRARAGPR